MPLPQHARLAREISQRILKKYVDPLRVTGGRIPTNRMLAAEFDVNIGTVTRAIAVLIERGLVRAVIGSGTYVLPTTARKLRFGICHGVYLADERPENRIYPLLFQELQKAILAADADLKLYLDDSMKIAMTLVLPPDLTHDVHEGSLDGLIVMGALADDRGEYLSLGVPTVGLGVCLSCGGVFLDRRAFIGRAVDKLLQRGAKGIAMLITHEFQESHLEPYLGDRQSFIDVLADNGLSFRPEWLVDPIPFQADPLEHGKMAFLDLWQVEPSSRPDAIIVGSDAVALGLLQGAEELGVRVPGDVLVAVAENRENVWPELAGCLRFQFSAADMAECAVRILLAGTNAAPATLTIAPKFVRD